MAATHVVQLPAYETPENAAAVKAAAKRDGIPITRWVRSAIREKLKKDAQNGKGQGS